ncbi:MAG TPA: RidA family protein [Rhizomicrobium sp.]|jgi:enamine deaminase RidA (YjgF/YER057c/UK114 family)|nr:RidA family protein [Rhizomicrobium sp.]
MKAINPQGWPQPKGYANGMLAENGVLLVAGQIGWDTEGKFADGFAAQVKQALLNIRAVVEAAGGRVDQIGRLTWYVTNLELYRNSGREIGAAYREAFGKNFPAMAVVEVSGLVEREALVEIEATAVIA